MNKYFLEEVALKPFVSEKKLPFFVHLYQEKTAWLSDLKFIESEKLQKIFFYENIIIKLEVF
ncbi:hypothetical protein BW152_11805 [Lactococcus lactis]|nr:hypothetical protein BW152_11805 [Lactococcus lactis]